MEMNKQCILNESSSFAGISSYDYGFLLPIIFPYRLFAKGPFILPPFPCRLSSPDHGPMGIRHPKHFCPAHSHNDRMVYFQARGLVFCMQGQFWPR